MLSKRYFYKSNSLKEQYVNNAIDYQTYMTQLEILRSETLSVVHSWDRASLDDEIWDYETKQQDDIKRLRTQKERSVVEQEKRLREVTEAERIAKEAREREAQLTPEQKLFRERQRFYQQDVPRLIEEYERESRKNRTVHNRLQGLTIIGSTIVTSVTSITIFTNLPNISLILKITAAAFSLLVSIATGFAGYFKYRERSVNFQEAANDIELEQEAVKLGTHIYFDKPGEEAMGIFVDRVISMIRAQKEQQQLLEQPPEARKAQKNA